MGHGGLTTSLRGRPSLGKQADVQVSPDEDYNASGRRNTHSVIALAGYEVKHRAAQCRCCGELLVVREEIQAFCSMRLAYFGCAW